MIALFQFALEFQPFGFPIGGGVADNQENVFLGGTEWEDVARVVLILQ